MKPVTFLLEDWAFTLDSPALQRGEREPWQADFDDSAWEPVVVPHDWAVHYPFWWGYSSGTGYLPGGTGWYRARFKLPAGFEPGSRVFLDFDGVYKNSRVWCNGSHLGGRPSGYSPFSFEITHALRTAGEDNVITVLVRHEDITDSRWYTGSGVNRSVRVRVLPAVCVQRETVFIRHNDASDEINNFVVTGSLICGTDEEIDSLKISALVYDGDTVVVRREISVVGLKSGKNTNFYLSLVIPDVKLWSPAAPNLYTLVLQTADKHEIPLYAGNFGARSIVFNPDKGLFVNGKHVKIQGVNLHDDCGCLGSVFWRDVWRRRLLKLKEVGCNAIRMSHNPHAESLYELCDETGFLVLDEAFDEWEGAKNKWTHGHNVYPPAHQGYSEFFPAWAERDIEAMVVRGRNHPSIILWSVGNEIDYPNDPYCHPSFAEMTGNNDKNKPAAERLYNPSKPNMERIAVIAKRLVSAVRRFDTTRPVLTGAAFPQLSSKLGFLEPFDVVGYNYLERLFAEDHKRFPDKTFVATESVHTDEPWKIVKKAPYAAGQFLWAGIDFLGEAQGWPVRGSGCGLLDLAGYEKAGFAHRRFLWTGEREDEAEPLSAEAPARIEASLWGLPFSRDTKPVSVAEKAGLEAKTRFRAAQIEVRLVDASGKRCAQSSALVRASASGNARIIGLENGDISDCCSYAARERRAFEGRLIVYALVDISNPEAGEVTLSAPGLPEARTAV